MRLRFAAGNRQRRNRDPGLYGAARGVGASKPLRGADHRLAAHDNQTAVLIETLRKLSREPLGACNIFADPDHAAAAIAARNIRFRSQGETLENIGLRRENLDWGRTSPAN